MKSEKKKQAKQALRNALIKRRDENILLKQLGEIIHAEHKQIYERQKEMMLPVLQQYINSLMSLPEPNSEH
jgi:hypothetical protein